MNKTIVQAISAASCRLPFFSFVLWVDTNVPDSDWYGVGFDSGWLSKVISFFKRKSEILLLIKKEKLFIRMYIYVYMCVYFTPF